MRPVHVVAALPRYFDAQLRRIPTPNWFHWPMKAALPTSVAGLPVDRASLT
jgi:hypothetical protein